MGGIVSSIFGGGSSGGGGTSTTVQKTEIPKWIEEPTVRNIARAEEAAKIGYMPWTGLDVAGFTPTQQAAMQMNIDAAKAFGMLPSGYSGLTAMSGMPATTTQGGVSGWSSYPMYQLALAELAKQSPTQVSQYKGLFV
jgi:hypothetical protein